METLPVLRRAILFLAVVGGAARQATRCAVQHRAFSLQVIDSRQDFVTGHFLGVGRDNMHTPVGEVIAENG